MSVSSTCMFERRLKDTLSSSLDVLFGVISQNKRVSHQVCTRKWTDRPRRSNQFNVIEGRHENSWDWWKPDDGASQTENAKCKFNFLKKKWLFAHDFSVLWSLGWFQYISQYVAFVIRCLHRDWLCEPVKTVQTTLVQVSVFSQRASWVIWQAHRQTGRSGWQVD